MVIKCLKKKVNIVNNEQTYLKYFFWVLLDGYPDVQSNSYSNCNHYTNTSRFHFDCIYIGSLYEVVKLYTLVVPAVPYNKHLFGRQNFCWKKISSPRKRLGTFVRQKTLPEETWLTNLLLRFEVWLYEKYKKISWKFFLKK